MDTNFSWSTIDSFTGNFTSLALIYHRPCPICESLLSRVVWEINDFQFYSDSAMLPKRTDVRVNQCLGCYALYLNPCYSDFGFQILFAEAGQSYGSTDIRPSDQVEWLTTKSLLHPGTQILDVGCYDGRFLALLPQNVRRVGVDIDQNAIERGRLQFGAEGIEFVCGDFETFQFSGTPDTIIMFHVLEHLPRPVAALRKLRSMAHDGTRLVVEVPILENGATNDINGFFSVQHMTHFSRRSLQNCLARAGWRIVEYHENPDYNGCRVIAEPCKEKSTIVCNSSDVTSLYKYLSSWYQALVSVEQIIAELANVKKCVIWGGGAHTEFLYHMTSFFHTNREREYVIVDSDPIKHGRIWRGIPIFNPSMVREIDLSKLKVLVSSYGSQEIIIQAAINPGFHTSNIIKLYKQVKAY